MSLSNIEISNLMPILIDGSNELLVSLFIDVTTYKSVLSVITVAILAFFALLFTIGTLVTILGRIKPKTDWDFLFRLVLFIPALILLVGLFFAYTTTHIDDDDFKSTPSAEALAKIDKLTIFEMHELVDMLTDRGCFSLAELKNPTICSSDLQKVLLKKATAERYASRTEMTLTPVLALWSKDVDSGKILIKDIVGVLKSKDSQTGMELEEYLTSGVATEGSTPQTNFNFVKSFYVNAESLKDSCGALSKNNCDIIKAVYVNEVKKLAGEAIINSDISKENYSLTLEKAKAL